MSTGKTLAIVAVGFGVVGVGMIAAWGGLLFLGYQTANKSVGPEIDQQFAAIDGGTFAETYESATTPEFRSATSKDHYADIGKAVATRLGRLQSKSLKTFNMRQHNADSYVDVAYDASFEKGSGQILAKMKREQGRMKLVEFRVNSPVFTQDIATAKCPKCGAPHTSSARFCPSCGAQLSDDAGATSEKTPDWAASLASSGPAILPPARPVALREFYGR